MKITTLRLRDNAGRTDGEWYAETIKPYHYAILSDYRRAEPSAGWHLETRGYGTDWHTYEPPLSEAMFART